MRSVVAALCAAGLAFVGLSACTGDATSGTPLRTSSGGTATRGAPSGSSTAAPASTTGPGSSSASSASSSSGTAAPTTVVTGFRRLWTWQVLPPDKYGFGLHTLDDAVLDGDRLVWADVVRQSPVGIVGSKVRLVSADLATRKVLWSHTFKGEPKLLQVVDDTVVLSVSVGVGNDQGTSPLYAFAASSGKARWHSMVGPGVAVSGHSLVVQTNKGGVVTTSLVDVSTGRASVTSTGSFGLVTGAAGDRVVFGADGQVAAADSALKPAWRAGSVTKGVTDTSVVGDAVIVWSANSGRQDVVAYDLDTGRRRWHKQVTLDSAVSGDSIVDGRLVLRTEGAMFAFGADGSTWTVPESAVKWVGAGAVPGSPVGCGQSLVSLSADGRLYAHADLPNDQFLTAPCRVAPLMTGRDAALPNAAVVIGETAIVAYRTTSGTGNPKPADGTGRWGPLGPTACPGRSTLALARALGGSLGPRWYVLTVDHRQCVWRGNGSFPIAQTGMLSSAANAKRFVNPRADGGCKVKGWTGGAAATVPSSGLPAGSGICSLLGNRSGGRPTLDLYSGATRTRNGTWLSVSLFYPSNKGADFEGGRKLLGVLRRLAA